MGSLKLNLAEVEVRDFEALPAGRYHVRVTDWEPREAGQDAKNPGKYYINLEMTIVDGPYEDRKLWTNVNFLPNALFTLKALATALDIESELEGIESDDETFEDMCQQAGQIIADANKDFVVRVAVRQYNGNDQNDVKAIYAATPEQLAKCAKGEKGSVPAQAAAAKAGKEASLLP